MASSASGSPDNMLLLPVVGSNAVATTTQTHGEPTQYDYCKHCRVNHIDSVRHVYSKKHKNIIKQKLQKFSTRLAPVLEEIQSPTVADASATVHCRSKIWCYFCEMDCDIHSIDQCVVLKNAGLIVHLSSSQHVDRLNRFWVENRVGNTFDKTQFYVMHSTTESFLKTAVGMKMKFIVERNEILKDDANKIKQVEKWRQDLLANSVEAVASPWLQQQSPPGSGNKNRLSENITRPPWLEDDANSQTKIGPTLDDYKNHLNRLQKNSLPSNRVGALFDRTSHSSSSWLPSFGQVWNHGRRTRTRTRKFAAGATRRSETFQ